MIKIHNITTKISKNGKQNGFIYKKMLIISNQIHTMPFLVARKAFEGDALTVLK